MLPGTNRLALLSLSPLDFCSDLKKKKDKKKKDHKPGNHDIFLGSLAVLQKEKFFRRKMALFLLSLSTSIITQYNTLQ